MQSSEFETEKEAVQDCCSILQKTAHQVLLLLFFFFFSILLLIQPVSFLNHCFSLSLFSLLFSTFLMNELVCLLLLLDIGEDCRFMEIQLNLAFC